MEVQIIDFVSLGTVEVEVTPTVDTMVHAQMLDGGTMGGIGGSTGVYYTPTITDSWSP